VQGITKALQWDSYCTRQIVTPTRQRKRGELSGLLPQGKGCGIEKKKNGKEADDFTL